MKLRTRLVLTLAALTIPFAVLVAWWQARSRLEAFEESTAALAVARMEAGERELCEAFPQNWPRIGLRGRHPQDGRGDCFERRRFGGERRLRALRRGARALPVEPGFAAWAYDARFGAASASAPLFDTDLRRSLESGEPYASRPVPHDESQRLVAVRMPWDEGPCAILLLRRAGDVHGGLRGALVPALLVSLAAVVMAAFAAGPIVARIRRLTASLRAPEGAPGATAETGGRDEIAELARAFEERRATIRAQIDELEARDATLRKYVANTTHDVMLPLTVVQGHLVALEKRLDGDALSSERVRAALEECHYLGSLVHNLSVASKLDRGERAVELHRLDLRGVVERVVARNRPYAERRSVELAYSVPDAPVETLADVTLLEQALGNVVNNAVRYGRAGGHVAVVLASRAGRFSVRTLDDGPGVPEEELARVAERGFRGGEARTRHPHGMGLGLSIAMEVAERHGFTLRFECPSEGGLAVTFDGPLAAPTPAPAPAPSAQ